MKDACDAVPVRCVLGVPIHAATMQQVLRRCEKAIGSHGQLMISVVNAAKLVYMRRQQLLRDAVQDADLVLADGLPVVWASRILGQPLPERVAGIDLFYALMELADKNGYSVYFLGAEQSVLDEMLRRARSTYPKLRIAGSRNGYFDDRESRNVADDIRNVRPDILFVGITSPKKEVFLAAFADRLNVPVCHGVGGSFDIFAGQVKRAPTIWQQYGLEWLYRTLQEPRRLWKRYLITNSIFIWMLLSELARGARARAAART